jgi:hypothetical protein
MMFKILVIQTTNNLSDERAEFLINDRLSFMRFLGFGLSDRVPDWTIWLFREKLTKAGAIGPLFERFDATLRQSGYIAMAGQIVDASLIAAPRQRNTQDEKKAIKDGRIPDDWKDKPAKLRQKDRDARWTVKYTKAKPREDGSTPPVDLATWTRSSHRGRPVATPTIGAPSESNCLCSHGAECPEKDEAAPVSGFPFTRQEFPKIGWRTRLWRRLSMMLQTIRLNPFCHNSSADPGFFGDGPNLPA